MNSLIYRRGWQNQFQWFATLSLLTFYGFSSGNSPNLKDDNKKRVECCGMSANNGNPDGLSLKSSQVTIGADKKEFSTAVFERMKKLEGEWKGKSTKGWEDVMRIKVIANGSVIFFDSFGAHPNETMVTLVHLDLDRLLVNHYCVAKNQPRLEATSFEENGNKVTFTFLDATNLPSRDKGHMDKLVIRFIDDDHYTSQWTWYQNGKENWMEEIHHERTRDGNATSK